MKKFFIFAMFIVFLSSISFSLGNFTLYTEQYPPYNYEENGVLKGISIDLIDAVLKKAGSAQTKADISLVAWSRGYNLIQSDPRISLFAMTRTEAREKLFKWVGPISDAKIIAVAKKSKKIKINSPSDFNLYKIGAVRDDIGEQLIIENGADKNKIENTGDNISNIRKLDKDRIEIFAYDENVFKYTAKSLGINPSDFESVYTLKEGQLYFAFSKDTPDSEIRILQDALDSLVKDGTHRKILDKYLK